MALTLYKKERPTETIYLDDPSAAPMVPRRWPTSVEQAASRKEFDARLAAEHAAEAEVERQCKENGRCEHGPDLLQSESWTWTRDPASATFHERWEAYLAENRYGDHEDFLRLVRSQLTAPIERLFAEHVSPRCHYGNMAGACQHWGRPHWGSCGLISASGKGLLPPWARNDSLSDEEWDRNFNRWVEEANEHERKRAGATTEAATAAPETAATGKAGT